MKQSELSLMMKYCPLHTGFEAIELIHHIRDDGMFAVHQANIENHYGPLKTSVNITPNT